MAGVEAARGEQVAQLAREPKEAEGVGDGGPLASHPARHLLLGEAKLLLQTLEGLGLLQRGQLLALDVLHEGQLEEPLVRHLPHDHGDGGEADLLRGPPAPLPRDDLVALPHPADEDRLDHPALPEGGGQLAETGGVQGRAGLEGVRVEVVDRDLGASRLRKGDGPPLRLGNRQQGREPLAEGAPLQARHGKRRLTGRRGPTARGT